MRHRYKLIRTSAMIAATGAFAVLAAPGAAADTITFQQGADNALVSNYQGTEDATLNAGQYADENWGAYTRIYAYNNDLGHHLHRTGLIRFDVTSLAGHFASIDSVTLVLTQLSGDSGNDPVSIYSVSDADAGWIAGDKAGGSPDMGEVTWNNLHAPDVPWAGAPGASVAGTDYLTPALASFTYDGQGGVQDSVSLPAALIASWVNGENAGLIIRTGSGAENVAKFASADSTTQSDHPMLVVSYTPVPEPASLALLALGGLVLMRCRRSISRP